MTQTPANLFATYTGHIAAALDRLEAAGSLPGGQRTRGLEPVERGGDVAGVSGEQIGGGLGHGCAGRLAGLGGVGKAEADAWFLPIFALAQMGRGTALPLGRVVEG